MADGNLTRVKENAAELVLKNLGLQIGGRRILDDISLAVKAARLGIVGRNGSGKSTLARVLAGLLPPGSGSAEVNGTDFSRNRKAALREVGFLFQNPDHQIIFPTVMEEVAFGLRQLGQKKSEAEANALKTLSDFGSAHWAEAHISTLSQGQKHLVCIMSVFAMQPEMIILDEPFTGLDIPTRLRLNRVLEKYPGTLLHVSHDPADLQHYDHIIWLEKGRVYAEGRPEDLLPRYRDEMTRPGGTDDFLDLAD